MGANIQPTPALAIVTFNAVSLFSVGIEPILAAALGSDLGLADHQVGNILSAEFAGAMLATFPALWWARRVLPRWVAVITGVLFFSANLASSRYPAYIPLLFLRGLAGLAEGTLLILTLTIAARAPQPAQLYGWWVIGQTVVAAAGLLLFPQLSGGFGLAAIYTAMAFGILLVLPLAWSFSDEHPAIADDPNGTADSQLRRLRAGGVILTVLFLYYTVAGGIWAFAGNRGSQLNLAPRVVGGLLGLSYVISLAGAGLAAWLGIAPRYRHFAVIGHIGLGLALALFAIAAGIGSFTLFAVVLQFAWAFTAPLLMALVAEIEPVGSMIASATFVTGAGLMLGPLMAGHLFELQGGPGVLSLCFAAVVSAGALLLGFHKSASDISPS
jgi:MFS family permease